LLNFIFFFDWVMTRFENCVNQFWVQNIEILTTFGNFEYSFLAVKILNLTVHSVIILGYTNLFCCYFLLNFLHPVEVTPVSIDF
jgi:hypothetical protein